LLALAADLLLIGAGAVLGSFAFFLKPSGWCALLGTLWIVAFAIGWLVLKKFHLVFPF
jgi:hypothetical protein